MSDNMTLYNAVRTPPSEAIRKIEAGRLKGKSDINPMWRIKALTEQFGPCGIGWKYTIEKLWTEQGANGEVAAFALINLYHRVGEDWSEPIPGIGGNSFVAKEKSGMYTSDECYKMALTDALSVAWEGTAKFISQWFRKGSLILVEGALRTRKYTDKSGNNRTITEVLVSQGHFTGEKSNRASADVMPGEGEFSGNFAMPPAAYQAAAYNTQLPPPPKQMGLNDFAEVPSDEDLPF